VVRAEDAGPAVAALDPVGESVIDARVDDELAIAARL
jgi:hypothetical protein